MNDQTNTPGRKEEESFKALLYPTCSGCGLGCFGTFVIGFLGIALGYCLNPFDFFPFGGILSAVLVASTVLLLRFRNAKLSRKLFLGEVAVAVVLVVSFFAWDTPRYLFGTYFMVQKTPSVKIRNAQWEPHPLDPAVWMHFMATPQTISSIIETNRLELRTDHVVSARKSENNQPDWWQPDKLG